MNHSTQIIAHRGASGMLPENTLGAFELALKQNAHAIELDIVLTKDHQIIIRHDVFLSRSTDVASISKFKHKKTKKNVDGILIEDWFAIDFTLDEIKELGCIQPYLDRPQQFNSLYQIPTLKEIIDFIENFNNQNKKEAKVFIEIKNSSFHKINSSISIEKLLVDLLKTENWDKKNSPANVMSFEVQSLKDIRTEIEVKLFQLMDEYNRETNQFPQPYDFVLSQDKRTYKDLISKEGLNEIKTYADGLAFWKGYFVDNQYKISKNQFDFIKEIHQMGLEILCWTFKNTSILKNESVENEYKEFLKLGIDGFITDYPERAIHLQKK
jgi:glycerophosphoryl diester phosphodiesterase